MGVIEKKIEKKKTDNAIQYWTMTYNSDEDGDNNTLPSKDLIIQFFEERGWRFCFQLEKVKRFHYQGRIDILRENRCRLKGVLSYFELAGFNTKNLTLTPESNNSISDGGALFYTMKLESRIEGFWCDASFTPPVKPIKYMGEDLECMNNPYPFQKLIIDDITNNKPDDRTITWIFNKSGNIGKSKLQKFLCWKYGVKRICMGTATQIKTALCNVGARTAYVCNLPKVSGNQESQKDLFSAFEDVKDGWISSNMYGKDQELFMKNPHLYIFSNEVPNMDYASIDRWKVYQIKNKDDELKLMTEYEIRETYKEITNKNYFEGEDEYIEKNLEIKITPENSGIETFLENEILDYYEHI